MLKRPHNFSDIKGHPQMVEYCIEHIKNGTFPQFTIWDGEEGLGKTSFADIIAISIIYGLEDSEEKTKAIKDVIDNKRSNDSIKKYKMSVEGGKDAAKEVLSEFNLSLTPYGKKVIICDECHRMSDAAQDTLIQDTEYLPKGLYLILLSKESHMLQSTLKSRAVPLHLHRLKHSDMLGVLREEVVRRNLTIQGGDATLNLIATWAECKPRTALNILSAFADNTRVSSSMVKELIGYLEVDDILPLVTSLSGSMTFGLGYISEMRISDSILDVLVEFLKIKKGQQSYKLQLEEMRRVKEAVSLVSEESMVKFIYKLASYPKITRVALIASFMQSHDSSERLFVEDKNVLKEELMQKSEVPLPDIKENIQHAPTVEELIRSAQVIQE